MTTYMMLACPTLKYEIDAIMAELDVDYPVFYIPDELHLRPENLRKYLADFIPRLRNVDYLLLPMGKCGEGTTGVPSGSCTLVLPRSEDCISLLLAEESLDEVNRPKYTYFFTQGWLDYEHAFTKEYVKTVEKYGQETADQLMGMMYGNYKYFGFVDTGYSDKEASIAEVEPLAKTVNTEIVELNAPLSMLRKMLALDFDDDNFLLVPPNSTVDFGIGAIRR